MLYINFKFKLMMSRYDLTFCHHCHPFSANRLDDLLLPKEESESRSR